MKNIAKRLSRFILKIIAIFFITSVLLVLMYRFVNPPITPLMVIRLGQQMTDSLYDVRFRKNWIDFEKISPNASRAVIASEDQKFVDHFGFDLEAMQKALKNNQRGKAIKGGSTITNQVAKNVFLWPGRSYIRKGFEAYFTLLIETFWSKKRILEIYLNMIEMGNGIYGIDAGSKVYFNKSPAKLTRNEAALIAAVLPNPRKWSPAKPSKYILKRQKWITRNMGRLGEIPLEKQENEIKK